MYVNMHVYVCMSVTMAVSGCMHDAVFVQTCMHACIHYYVCRWSVTPETLLIPMSPLLLVECAIVDGGGFLDADTMTWHYLGQCLARDEVWNMCHFTRHGDDPLGPWTPNPANPVVRSGQLWGYVPSNEWPRTAASGAERMLQGDW